MTQPLISLHDAGVCYRRAHGFFKGNHSAFWALKKISLTLSPGETIGIIGRNGAGKSTLLRLLAGIIAPDRGRIDFQPGLRSNLLSIGVGSHSTLSGRENSILNGMMLGATKEKMVASLSRIREFSELGRFFEEPIYTYSSGMAARLGFATALEVDPDVMLIDEMLSVGDSSFRQKSAQALKDRLRNGKTAVLVSHDSATIADLCHRAVWLENGISVAEGETKIITADYEKSARETASQPENFAENDEP